MTALGKGDIGNQGRGDGFEHPSLGEHSPSRSMSISEIEPVGDAASDTNSVAGSGKCYWVRVGVWVCVWVCVGV